ncbi:MAG: DUF389 domain-containing protein [Leptospiraceae bacterium]|nr:DUF389 domain-containing protein [Leptospiraceae bacterium]
MAESKKKIEKTISKKKTTSQSEKTSAKEKTPIVKIKPKTILPLESQEVKKTDNKDLIPQIPEQIEKKEDLEQDSFFDKIGEKSGKIHYFFSQLSKALSISQKDSLLMHDEISDSVRLRSVSYWMLIVASIGIATLGLIINSPAVIIGAMLVSPLMSPIIGLGLSVGISDFFLGLKSVFILTLSIMVAIFTSATITLLLPGEEPKSEILSRVNPTILDLFVALFSGLVAALSSVRSNNEEILGKAGPGAAIGVALMPPLCVVGYGLGSGFQIDIMWGAFLLFITNMVAIIFISSVFYYFVYYELNIGKITKKLAIKREKTDSLFRQFQKFPLYKTLTENITSAKRFLFPAIFLVLISYPLSTSFIFIKQKNSIRSLVKTTLNRIEGVDIIRGTGGLSFTRESVQGTIIFSSKAVLPPSFAEDLNQSIEKNFQGFSSSISLVRVTNESDLFELKNTTIGNRANLLLDNIPPSIQNSIRNQHASELVKVVLDKVGEHFPEEIGIITTVDVKFSTLGMKNATVYYAGQTMSNEEKSIFENSLLSKLKELKREIKEVTLETIGPMEKRGECGANASAVNAVNQLQGIMSQAEENPKLKLELSVRQEIENLIKSKFFNIPSNVAIKKFKNNKENCIYFYKFIVNSSR